MIARSYIYLSEKTESKNIRVVNIFLYNNFWYRVTELNWGVGMTDYSLCSLLLSGFSVSSVVDF